MKKYLTILIHLHVAMLFFAPSTFALKAKIASPAVAQKTIQFEGIVEPVEKFQLFLRQGEDVVRIDVQLHDRVAAGEVVAELFNESLYSLYIESIAKKNEYLERVYLYDNLKITRNGLVKKVALVDERLALLAEINGGSAYPNLNEKIFVLQEEKMQLDLELAAMNRELEFKRTYLKNNAFLPDFYTKKIGLLEKRIDLLTLKSMVSGEVKKVHRTPDRANPGELLVEIWDTSKVVIMAHVSQNHAEYLDVGDRLKITYDYFSDEYVMGEILSIGDALFRQNGAGFTQTYFPVKVSPENAMHLRLGNEVILKGTLENRVAKDQPRSTQ